MAKSAFVASIIFLFCISFATDSSPPPIFDDGQWQINFYAGQSQLRDNSIVEVAYRDDGGNEYQTVVSTRNGAAAIYPSKKPTYAKFTYDLPSTPAIDYSWGGKWNFEKNNASVVLKPMAEVSGMIYGDIVDMILPQKNEKKVTIICAGGFSQSNYTYGGAYFSFASVPAGECTVSASDFGFGTKAISLSPGDSATANLKPLVSRGLIILAIFAILALSAVYLFFRNKLKKPKASYVKKPLRIAAKPHDTHPQQIQMAISSRQADLLSTLNAKEKEIVQFVQKSHPAAVKAAKIRNALLIPKTSLTRTLQSLERKQFLSLKKDGSRLYAKLHEFYVKG